VTAPGQPDWIRPLGLTGLAVSAVCVGGAPLGSMPENFGHEVAYADAVALVESILDSPIRWIDTSNGYSGGESERRIGAGISRHGGLPRDFLIATKVDPRSGDYSGARVRDSVAESKQRLGLTELPLVYLHDPENFDFKEMTKPGGAVEVLMALRDEGEIGHVGLAGGPVQEMSRYLELGGFEVLLVHNRWTLVDHSADDLIAQAEDLGLAVVNAAIYGGGILANPTGRTTYGYRPAPPETLQAIHEMDRVCGEAGTTLATAALLASVRDPRITATVVGISKPSRLARIVASLTADLPGSLLDHLADLLPDRHNWLDFGVSELTTPVEEYR
jgi:D-threo-aldose 1-dehydrogenase